MEIQEEIVGLDAHGISPDAARALLSLRFSETAVARINELAAKNRQGTLTPAERALLERYQRVGNFLNLVHARARCALAEPTASAS
jgi:hypothetical protein